MSNPRHFRMLPLGHLVSRLDRTPRLTIVLLALACQFWSQVWGQDNPQPNVLFIVADDLGIGDVGCYGNPSIDTPHIDQLAEQGVRLLNYYSASPLCAPSRASLLTGRFNHRTGAVDVPSNRGLDRIALNELTFGDYFRRAGYSTALVGKWHNGLYCQDYLPNQRGFDRFLGFANGGQDYYRWNLLDNAQLLRHDGRYLTDVLNDACCEVIRQSVEQSRPFAIFLAHHAPHSPLQAPESLVQKYRRRLGPNHLPAVAVIYAMIEAMDRGLGRVWDTLRELGQWENTIIVFTSDNGAFVGRDAKLGSQARFQLDLRGNKGDCWEQGLRVPCLAVWPNHIPADTLLESPVHGTDWLPTLLAQTRLPLPADAKPFDGYNVMPWLIGQADNTTIKRASERLLYFQRNRYAPVRYANAAVRRGEWKLVWPGGPEPLRKDIARDNPSYLRGIEHAHWEMPLDRQLDPPTQQLQPDPQLFNLMFDPREEHDVADEHAELVSDLRSQYDAWFTEMMNDWQNARSRIITHDQVYWQNRSPPDPRVLFKDYWQWKRAKPVADPETDDPLQVFRGYWTAQ